MKIWTLMIQRRWSQAFNDLKEISIGRMDFDNPKVYSDTSISDGLVIIIMILISYEKMSSPTHTRTDKADQVLRFPQYSYQRSTSRCKMQNQFLSVQVKRMNQLVYLDLCLTYKDFSNLIASLDLKDFNGADLVCKDPIE